MYINKYFLLGLYPSKLLFFSSSLEAEEDHAQARPLAAGGGLGDPGRRGLSVARLRPAVRLGVRFFSNLFREKL